MRGHQRFKWPGDHLDFRFTLLFGGRRDHVNRMDEKRLEKMENQNEEEEENLR